MQYDVRNCGCIYVAFGVEYLMMAAHSALTLKRHNPSLGTALVTNVPLDRLLHRGAPIFGSVIHRDRLSAENRADKLSVDLHSPFYKTVYLDCDTEIRGDLSPIFLLLDNYDIAVRLLNRVTKASFMLANGLYADALNLSEWNSGVIFFRKTPASSEMFRKWREVFAKEGMSRDQPAFMRAILGTRSLHLLPLSPLWNAKPTLLHEFNLLEREPHNVRIFHYREPSRRPEIARAIYRTYRELTIELKSEGNDPANLTVANEIRRFSIVYYYYAIVLGLLDHQIGRRLLRWRKGLVMRIAMRAILRLHNLCFRENIAGMNRDQRMAGRIFAKSARG